MRFARDANARAETTPDGAVAFFGDVYYVVAKDDDANAATDAKRESARVRYDMRPASERGKVAVVATSVTDDTDDTDDASSSVAVDLAAAAEDVAFFFENLVVDLSGARLSYRNMRVGEGVVTLDLDLEVVGFPPPSSLGMI